MTDNFPLFIKESLFSNLPGLTKEFLYHLDSEELPFFTDMRTKQWGDAEECEIIIEKFLISLLKGDPTIHVKCMIEKMKASSECGSKSFHNIFLEEILTAYRILKATITSYVDDFTSDLVIINSIMQQLETFQALIENCIMEEYKDLQDRMYKRL